MAQQAEVQEEFEVVEEIPDRSYQSFLHSKEWAEIRRRVIERAGHVCEACGRAEAVIAHHLTMRYGFKPPLGVSRRFVDRVMRDFENAFNPGIAERAE
jgi:hypothetical protein